MLFLGAIDGQMSGKGPGGDSIRRPDASSPSIVHASDAAALAGRPRRVKRR
jgi:hypothetical protein